MAAYLIENRSDFDNMLSELVDAGITFQASSDTFSVNDVNKKEVEQLLSEFAYEQVNEDANDKWVIYWKADGSKGTIQKKMAGTSPEEAAALAVKKISALHDRDLKNLVIYKVTGNGKTAWEGSIEIEDVGTPNEEIDVENFAKLVLGEPTNTAAVTQANIAQAATKDAAEDLATTLGAEMDSDTPNTALVTRATNDLIDKVGAARTAGISENVYILGGKLGEEIVSRAYKTNAAREKFILENWDELTDIQQFVINIPSLKQKILSELNENIQDAYTAGNKATIDYMMNQTLSNPHDVMTPFYHAYKRGILKEGMEPSTFMLKMIEQHGDPNNWKATRTDVETVSSPSRPGDIASPIGWGAAKYVIGYAKDVQNSMG